MKNLCIITGASSGLGREFSLQLATLKTKTKEPLYNEFWLLARNTQKLKETYSLVLQKASYLKQNDIKLISLDLSKKETIQEFEHLLIKAKQQAKNNNLCIKTLVCNAGFGVYGEFSKVSLDWQLDMIQTNVSSLVGFCGVALKYMQKGSNIINTASLAAFLPLGNFSVYAATKSFVLSFSLSLAAEQKHNGINVCALCPGPVDTNFSRVASSGLRLKVRCGKSSKKVVGQCIKQSLKGKHIAIMLPLWRFCAFMSRFIPSYLGAAFTYKFCKRPQKNITIKNTTL